MVFLHAASDWSSEAAFLLFTDKPITFWLGD